MRIRAHALSVSLLAGLGILAVGCSSESDDGGGTGGGGSSTGGGAGIDAGNDAGNDAAPQCGQFCTASECCDCSEAECLTPYDACRCEPDCLDLIDCIRTCAPTDQPCQSACYDGHATGKEIYTILEACASKYCVSECLGAPGDAG